MFIYRTKRVNIEGHYRWGIQSSIAGSDYWVVVTNMEAKVPLYHKKVNALETIAALYTRDIQAIYQKG